MSHFSAHVQIEKDGSTNIPGPNISVSTGAPNLQSLFDLKIAQLRLEDGEILWNDARIPLQARGGNFEFAMDYASEGGRPVYLGQVSWQKFEIAALRNLPFTSNFSARFTLQSGFLFRDAIAMEDSRTAKSMRRPISPVSRSPHGPSVTAARLRLEDLWTILRQKDAPGGHIEFAGDGAYSAEQMNFNGRYTPTSHDQISVVSSRKYFRARQLSRRQSTRWICPIWKRWYSAET